MKNESVMKNEKIARADTIETKVYRELRRSIMQGVFSPGEKLSLRGLATALGTSVMPVRSALNRLNAERACEQGDNRSFIIPMMTPEKFVEVTFWRGQLEGRAAEIAAPVMSAENLDKIKILTEEMGQCFDAGDWRGVLNHNFDFHFTLYQAAPSIILMPMIEALWLQMGPFTHFALPSPRFVWNSEHHLKIIKAIGDKDGPAAARAVRNDIDSMSKFLTKAGFQERDGIRPVMSDVR